VSNIEERAKKVIIDQLGWDHKPEIVTPDACFVGDLGADSLDMVELAMALEEEFGTREFTDQEMEGISTVQDVFNLLERLTQAVAA